MMTDAKLAFVGIGTPLSLVGASGATFTAPLIVDLLGAGAGTLVTNIWGNSLLPGQADAMGVGGPRPELNISIGTALVANAGAPTLTAALQYAPDNGAGSPGAWQTVATSGAVTVAQGTANQVIWRQPWIPPYPVNLRPRFVQLIFTTPAATSFSAGTIASALVTTVRDDIFQMQQPRNYTVGPL